MASRGRPDESAIRREQILDAAARCIVAKGLRGASLEAIAREAGTTRGNVRHFLGNRDELVGALLERINSRDSTRHGELSDVHPLSARREALLEYLYGPEFSSQEVDTQVLLHFYLAARSDPSIRSSLTAGYTHILDTISGSLDGDQGASERTASVLLALALGRAILGELDLPASATEAIREHATRVMLDR